MVTKAILKKSKTGCTTCRDRKVKCDEVRPICGNCTRRYVNPQHCDYTAGKPATQKCRVRKLGQQVIPRSPHLSILGQQISGLSSYLSDNRHPKGDRLLEMRLIHHYTTSVCHLMNSGGDERLVYMWRRAIPTLASHYEVVLDSMLALAAIHLHSQAVDDSRLSITIPKYLDRVLINHRRNLLELDGKTAEPVFLTSALLSKIMWLVCHRPSPDESYKLPLAAYYVMRGANAVFSQRKSLLGERGYIWLADEPPLPITRLITAEQQSQLDDIEEEMRRLFVSFDVLNLPFPAQSAYHEASRYVLLLYKGYFGGVNLEHLRRLIVLTPVKVQSTFFTLLERNDPLAMALFARALVLSLKVGDSWWLQGSGKYEVVERDLDGMLTLMPPQYDFAMEWPRKVLSGEIAL